MFNKIYFSHYRVYYGRGISRNVASLNIVVHDVIDKLTVAYSLQRGKYYNSTILIFHDLFSWIS